jgi:hypothetical protein
MNVLQPVLMDHILPTLLIIYIYDLGVHNRFHVLFKKSEIHLKKYLNIFQS